MMNLMMYGTVIYLVQRPTRGEVETASAVVPTLRMGWLTIQDFENLVFSYSQAAEVEVALKIEIINKSLIAETTYLPGTIWLGSGGGGGTTIIGGGIGMGAATASSAFATDTSGLSSV